MSTGNPVQPPSASPPSLTWREPSGGAFPGGAGAPPSGGPGRPGKGLALTLLVLGVAGVGLGGYILQYATRRSAFVEDDVFTALAIGGAGIVLLALGLQRLLRGRAGWLAAAATVLVLGGATTAVVLRAQAAGDEYMDGLAARSAVLDRLQTVCTAGAGRPGAPVPEAAPYDRSPGLHPAAFFTTYSDGMTQGWAGEHPPASWRAARVEQAQVVVCNTQQKEVLETCSYTTTRGTSLVARVRYVQEVVLYEARTRTELARTRFEGSEPGPCPETMSFGQYESTKDWAGSYPGQQPILDFARPWIEVGPGGPPPAPR